MKNRYMFRVWKFYDGNIKEGFYLTEEEDVILWNHGALWRQDDCDDFSKEAIVEQCTGPKDINGKLIFEGDIFAYNGMLLIVGFECGAFIGKWHGSNEFIFINDFPDFEDKIEITGTIHDKETK